MTAPDLDALFASMPVSDWDKKLIEQAIHLLAGDGREFSMNDIRHLFPDMAHGTAGRVLRSMRQRKPSPIRKVGQVPSTSGPTHGKPIDVYVITPVGHVQAQQWRKQWDAARQGVAA